MLTKWVIIGRGLIPRPIRILGGEVTGTDQGAQKNREKGDL